MRSDFFHVGHRSRLIQRKTEHAQAAFRIGFCVAGQERQLLLAGFAIRGPERDENHLAQQIARGDLFAVQCIQHQRRRQLAQFQFVGTGRQSQCSAARQCHTQKAPPRLGAQGAVVNILLVQKPPRSCSKTVAYPSGSRPARKQLIALKIAIHRHLHETVHLELGRRSPGKPRADISDRTGRIGEIGQRALIA